MAARAALSAWRGCRIPAASASIRVPQAARWRRGHGDMKKLHTFVGALLATALALPPLPAWADATPPPGMLSDASNAALPGAVQNLGILDPTSVYYTLGAGLYPQYAGATTTTADTTSGSPTI